MLQEAGKTEVVLQIGESLLRERLPKSFKQDVVLAMALAYVDLSRDAMALNPPDFIRGCEVLERALKLLQVRLRCFLNPSYRIMSFALIRVFFCLKRITVCLCVGRSFQSIYDLYITDFWCAKTSFWEKKSRKKINFFDR